MDNLRCLLGIRRMDRIPNAQKREFSGVTREVDERIDVERMEWDRTAKRVYVGECVSSRSVGRPPKI